MFPRFAMPDWFFPAESVILRIAYDSKELNILKAGAFLRGMGIGLVAGVAMDMAVNPRPKPRKTAVGKTMEKVGTIMDSAIQNVSSMVK
jgi:hypothetical protein